MKKVTAMVVLTALVGFGAKGWADDVNATGNNNDPLKHPVNAYTNHEVKEDMKDGQEAADKAAEAKATYKQAKADYDKSLKDNGAASEITKDAKKRMHEAHADVQKYTKDAKSANAELKKDETKAQQ